MNKSSSSSASRLPLKGLWPAVLLPCLCLSLATVMLFVYAYSATKNVIRDNIANDMRAIAKLKTGQIEHWLADRHDDVQLIATPHFKRELQDWLTSGRHDTLLKRHLIDQLAIPHTTQEPRTFILRDTAGRLLLEADSAAASTAASQLAREAALSGKVTREPMHFGLTTAQPGQGHPPIEMSYFTPLRLSEDSPVLAVLQSRMSPENVLYPLLQHWPGVSASAETMILSRMGDQVIYLNELRHLPGSALRASRPLAGAPLIAARVIADGEGFFEEADYRGIPSLAYGMRVAGTPWILIAKIDRSEAFHRLDTITGTIAPLGGLIILACAVWLYARKRKELQLAKLLAECENLYQQAPCGYHSIDRDGIFLRINDTELRMLGYTRNELIGKINVRQLMTETSQRQFDTVIRRTVALEEIRNIEFELIRKDGSIMPALINASAILDHKGEFLMTRFMMYDISERKVMEDQLRRSEERYRTLFQSIRDLVFVREVLPDGKPGRLIDFNDVACEKLGYSREELLTLNPFDRYPHAYTDQQNDDLYRSLELGSNVVFEQVQRAKDGSLTPVEISLSRFTLQGQSLYIALIRDISERKRHEEELHLMQRALESSAHGVMILKLDADSAPCISYVNPAFEQMTGYGAAEALGRTPAFLHCNGDVQPSIEELRKQFDQSFNRKATLRFFRKNRLPFWGEVVASPVLTPDGRITHYIAIINDITQRMAIEAELLESREQLRKLASHDDAIRETERKHMARELHDELGQTLTVLKMNIALLQMRFDSIPELMDKTEEMRTIIEKTISVVRNVVSSLRPAALDLGIVGALEWLADDFTRHTTTPCIYEGDDDEPAIDDKTATAVFRIAQESLTNIARHAHAHKVRIRLTCDHGILRLSVTDDGCGFDTSEIILNRKNFGLLGMQERVSMLAGNFHLSSTPGQGTNLEIELPLTPPPHQ